jgi:N-methylhydantoinase A/oxoprolinase/acetone carboxylase beta subunit
VSYRLDLRLGIDVGGTHTDAVLLDRENSVIAKKKASTTLDVTSGVRTAIADVVAQAGAQKSRISHVMLGTTHATNAVLERRRLHTVAVLRVGAPSSTAVRPFFGWPDDLVTVIGGLAEIVGGGFEYDGREIVPFDDVATRAFFTAVKGRVEAVAISAVFSPMSAKHELAAAEIARQVLGPDVVISLSHEIGSLGLLPRENATILNAALTGVARDVATAVTTSLDEHGINASVLFAQNDGTLMALDYAVRFPILTIGSGPANSIRGAAFLTGLTDALVADVGGTSTDFGMLVNGFPRESAANVSIGGVSTNFRMPDVLAIALGGGTVIRQVDTKVRLGPDSVGYRLAQEGIAFGGNTLTVTDAAVRGGRARIGTTAMTTEHDHVLAPALQAADEMIADAVDRMKLGRGDVPMIVVGGGAVLVPDSVPGVSKVVRPEHYDVANAIGAAIAQISGRWDEVVSLAPGRTEAIASACAQATARAIHAGADPDHIEIVEIVEIPLAYLTTPVARISVKAVGPLGRL